MTSTIIAHDDIAAELTVSASFAAEYDRGGEGVRLEIQHDPCCPGEVCFGVLHDSQRMQVTTLYLAPHAAVAAALALLAGAAHAVRGESFGDTGDGREESWRDAHARAMAWVQKHPAEAIQTDGR